MSSLTVNGVEIAYELDGPTGGPVVMLIHGLGMPLSAWPPELAKRLRAEGFRLLMFDNRDIGRSQLLDHLGTPNLTWTWLRRRIGLTVSPPYRLEDLAHDAAALLDALEVEAAHIVGCSMGGMIAQLLAIHHRGKVQSMTNIMSTTGNRSLPHPRPDVRRQLLRGPPSSRRADRIAHSKKIWRMIGSPAFPIPEAELDATLARIYDRGMPRSGLLRQMLAVIAAPSRVPLLRALDVPTLVVHGDQDPLVPLACGADIAASVPAGRLEVIKGMGHDLPAPVLAPIANLIATHVREAAS